MPSSNEFSIALTKEIGKKGSQAKEALSTATENALAAKNGSGNPTFSLPQGTIPLSLEGEQFDAAVPPYYLAIPLHQEGTSWRVPTEGFTVVKFANAEELIPPLRPVLCVSVTPDSLHVADPNVTINVSQAGWNPRHPHVLYQIGETIPVFSLSKKIQSQIGQTQQSTDQLTAGEFLDLVANSSKWPKNNDSLPNIIPWPTYSGIDTISLYQGMKGLTEKSSSLRRFWKNIEAKQVLSASLVMGDHQLLAAAIWSLLDVEQQNVPDFVGRKLELTNQLKSGQIVDWETYADAVHEIFTNVTYPVTLSIGWTGLQEFINQVMDWSLVPEREQKELVAKMMGIENPESLNMIRGINTDPVSLLLSSPQWISGMTVLLRDLMGMAFKTTEIKGDAVRKLMEAEQETAKLSLHSANELLNELKKAYPRMEKVSAKLAAGIVARLEQEMKDKLENNPIPSSSSHTTHTRNHILPSNQIIDVPPSSKE